MENFDIKKYLEMALRRKYWVVIPFMVVLLAGFAYLLKAPRIFEAKTLILVQEQRVPQDFVRSIVSADAEDRLRTITQQVTSRTNLEKIIADSMLYSEEPNMLLEEKVVLLRRNIVIDVAARGGRGGNAFSIALQGKDPRKIAKVTNDLASNFISEHIKIRESQALGTSIFLNDELESVRRELQDKEQQLKEYKERHRGGLPEELNTNLRILERLQSQLDQLNNNLRSAENRRILLQQGAVSTELSITAAAPTHYLSPRQAAIGELERLKNELKDFQLRYTENHPDIIDLKKQIESLETQLKSSVEGAEQEEGPGEAAGTDYALRNQLNDIQMEISGHKDEIAKVSSRIRFYEEKIEETPKREQELISITRDYNNLNAQFNSIMDRKLAADMSVSLERKQQGEQFRVIDPAQVPLKPVKPDAQKLLVMIIGLGLGLGCGIAYLVEMLDTSYRSPEDAEKELGFPVMVCLPYLFTEQELKARKKRRIITAFAMATGYCAAFVAVVILIKGFNETIEFIREIITKIGIA